MYENRNLTYLLIVPPFENDIDPFLRRTGEL